MLSIKSIKGKLAKVFHIRKRSEIEIITDSLIKNQLGKRGVIRKAFDKKVEGYNSENNPIGEKEAKEILNNMLYLITTSRHCLSADIGKSVAEGEMFQYYDKKQRKILDLSLDAVTKKQNMISAHEEYDHLNSIYLQVLNSTVKNEYHHAPSPEPAEERFRKTAKDFSQNNTADEATSKMNENTGDDV